MTPKGQAGQQPDTAAEPDERGLVRDVGHPHAGAAGEAAGRPGPQRLPVLRLAEVIMAILDHRRRLPMAASAALIREQHGDGMLVRVVFLDDRQEPLPAAADTMTATTYLAGRLDDDLAVAFGARNVIVLK